MSFVSELRGLDSHFVSIPDLPVIPKLRFSRCLDGMFLGPPVMTPLHVEFVWKPRVYNRG